MGNRYLNSKTLQPLTLRYIGTLPPSSNDVGDQIWLGVEYDDPSNGKGHNGIYKDVQVFQTLEEGSASFLKYNQGLNPLKRGNSLINSIEDRYGEIRPKIIPNIDNETQSQSQITHENESVVLGSSENAIIVQAPNLSSVREKVGKLEKLRNIGFEEEHIDSLGSDEETIEVLKQRMKGLKWLNLSKNLLSSWDQVLEIVDCFQGLEVLTLNHSRIRPIKIELDVKEKEKYIRSFSKIKELHLSNCLLSWDEVCSTTALFPNLEVLHVEANKRLNKLFRRFDDLNNLKELTLGGCPISEWQNIVSTLSNSPKLESLDLSFTSIRTIPSPSLTENDRKLDSLTTLTFLESSISNWSDLDNLSQFALNLHNLRLSVRKTPIPQDTNQEIASGQTMEINQLLSVDDKSLRSICIAEFPNLTMFNSNPITPIERRDSELFYISFVKKRIANNDEKIESWSRYEELCKLHNVSKEINESNEIGKKPKSGLKGRMIKLKIHTEGSNDIQEISILPSARITLLQRKLTKLFGIPVNQFEQIQIWNTTLLDVEKPESGLEKVNKVTCPWEDKEVGWWFESNDEIFVEFVSEDD
ncbi:uncharacterized protein L201_003567 [Kwoniella dendrophila CBS 6074]|uniref:CAP-Gly domain-containing protein n=1 Tax=Kwoniella dendrophila CBS 6074 TaxID=1295534 RepID=A0AAX4JUT7_9TREE